MLVARRGDDNIGFLVGHVGEMKPVFRDRRYASICDVFLLPEHRRRGAATRLVEEAVAFYRDRGFRHICIKVLADHEPSRAFCRKLGFADTIVRSSLVGVAMWKPLG